MSTRPIIPMLSAILIVALSLPCHAWTTTVVLGDFDNVTSRCTDAAFGDLFLSHGYNAWQVSAGVRAGVIEWGGDQLSILDRNTGIALDSRSTNYKSELTLRYDQHWLEELIVVFVDESDYNTPGFMGADISVVSARINPTTSISTTTLVEKLGGDSYAWGALAYQIFKPQQLSGTTHHTLRISVPTGGRYKLLAVVANSGRDITNEGRYIGVRSAVEPLDNLSVIEDPAAWYMDMCAVRERVSYY